MIEEGTRQLDLYDIVSVLIPGAALAVGLVPFLPQQLDIPSTLGIVLLLLIAFIFGRGIAAIGIQLESMDRPTSHREFFGEELRSPSYIDRRLADRFFTVARLQFSLHELPQARVDLNEKGNESGVSSLYSHVRSFIHMDARGRSRTFQAVLDFCRGMVVSSGILSFVYVGYAVTLLSGFQQSSFIPYQTYLGVFEFEPLLVIIFAGGLFAASYIVFEKIRSNYRRYYVQYLIIDFLVLAQNE